MRKISIKLRITLWFTSFMIVLVGITLAVLIVSEERTAKANLKDRLAEVVEDLPINFKITEEGILVANQFQDFDDGIYLSVYNSQGDLISGQFPVGFDKNIAFTDHKTQIIKFNNEKWLVYDKKYKIDYLGFVWIRGMVSQQNINNSLDGMLKISFYILPFLVIAVALGGYYIISRAFRPINHIIKTVDKIGEGKDLSQRINLGKGKDEIYTLADTFDRMFDRIESFYENEKRFTSDASHELRTPTTVIISQCEYALENAKNLEEAKEALDKVLQQAKKMTALITQLLTLARADKGEQKLHTELINLSELTEMVIEQQSELAAEKAISIRNNIEPRLLIKGDETMLMRMIINLIENGINYGREDGTLTVELKRQKNSIVLNIADEGIGIAADHIDKIWERFYQVDSSRNSTGSNVGLGLSMVKWIAEAHGGSVSAKSELNKGSVFTVVLPLNKNN